MLTVSLLRHCTWSRGWRLISDDRSEVQLLGVSNKLLTLNNDDSRVQHRDVLG
jgi:hypothetical protein